MSQNRPPPAFMEYAAANLANIRFRTMSLSARGLLYTMKLECWVNHELPSSAPMLAKVIGYDTAEVAASLSEVMPFFREENGLLMSPELEDYRAHLTRIRDAQAKGGQKGAAKTNSKHKSPESKAGQASKGDSGKPRVTRESSCESLIQSNPSKPNPTQSLEKGSADIDWLNDYERASNGG